MSLFSLRNNNRSSRTATRSATAAVEGLEGRRLFNGTLPTATDLGTLYGQVQKTDSVGASDVYDYYKVNMAYTGKLTARLTNLTANANLRIIKDINNNGVIDAGEVKGTSANAGTTSEQLILAPVGPGKFFIEVKRVAGTPSYKLTVKTDYAGQTFAGAHNLGTFTGTKTRKDRVDSEDPVDFYKIVLTSTKTVSATMTGTGDANLELSKDFDNDGVYDDGQDFIHRSNQPGTSTENLGSFTLGAGMYLIRVFRDAADAQYTVNIKVS